MGLAGHGHVMLWKLETFFSVCFSLLCLYVSACLSLFSEKKFKTRWLVSFLNAVCNTTEVFYIVTTIQLTQSAYVLKHIYINFSSTVHILAKLSFNMYLFEQIKFKQLSWTYALYPLLWLTFCLLFVYWSVCLSDVSDCFSLCLSLCLSLLSCLWMFVSLKKCLSCSYIFHKMFYNVLTEL